METVETNESGFTPFIYENIPQITLNTLFELINKFVPIEEWVKTIRLSALGGRMCWNSDSIENLLQEKKLINAEYYQFLKALSKKGHTSLFEHTSVSFDISERCNIDNFCFYIYM